MSRLQSVTVALFVGTTVIGLSQPGSAQYLEGADREVFVASATKACIGTYGNGKTGTIPKPLFEQYCVCAANGMADRIPMADLSKENGTDDLGKENEKIVDEEVTRCYAAIKEAAQQKNLGHN
jgi:hypothetical protein